MDPNDIEGRRVVLMGLGRFGGGIGAARFLARRGARLLITDRACEADLKPSLEQLSELPGIEYRLGAHRESDFRIADLVVASPAVRPEHSCLQVARDAGVPVTSEIRLFAQLIPDRRRVVGVTGTAGKSTVTAMIGRVLSGAVGAASVWVGGNLGGSLLERVDEIRHEDWIVLELSSFMLEGLGEDRWSPHIAVVTNVMPNHLDWHGSFEAYVNAKQNILRHQDERDVAILGQSVASWPTRGRREIISGDRAARRWELLIPGQHNQFNAQCAAEACRPVVAEWKIRRALGDFVGLPHRLQLVAEHDGVRYYNDSKSTTPEAAMIAVRSFEPRTAHAILGGSDKGSDLGELARSVADHCRAVYTIGTTGERIAKAADGARGAEVVRCGDIDTALAAIGQRLRRGEVVVLSPGCASYDQFANYEQRGRYFTEAVVRHTGAATSADG